MLEGHPYSCKEKREALEKALSIFGENARRLLVTVLEDDYKLVIDGRNSSTPCSSVEDIERALFDVTGSSAHLIISRMHTFLRSSAGRTDTDTTADLAAVVVLLLLLLFVSNHF